MNDDPRCCGSGACIVDPSGRCWCGQQWDGEKMCHAPLRVRPSEEVPAAARIAAPPEAAQR